MQLKPPPDLAFVHGPSTSDATSLRKWLEQQKSTVRLPVLVKLSNPPTTTPPLYAELEVAEGRLDLAALLEQLGSDAPLDDKREAAQKLKLAGRDAIPLLIASLSDGRPYEVRDLTNRMNLPPGAHPKPLLATLRVGERCENLLYDLVTPAVPGSNIKVFSEQALRISDWRAFWEKRRDRSLEQIHAELEPLVREYWKTHGTTQTVP